MAWLGDAIWETHQRLRYCHRPARSKDLHKAVVADMVDKNAGFLNKVTDGLFNVYKGARSVGLAALGLGKVYTFGPTFRAENSNTSRHLSEFWMIEPEVAFSDLKSNMDFAEEFLKQENIMESAA